jgi:hypothetical protein
VNRRTLTRLMVAVGGIFYALAGLALLVAPVWFFYNIGPFPPYNRHYEGDVGAFLLPLGLALLWAARDPFAHRLLIRYAGAASLLHALNHVYDDAQAAVPVTHLLTDALPLVVFAVLLILTSLGEPSGGVAPLPAKAGRREGTPAG